MTSNVVQTLIETRVEHPVEDVDEWVGRLTRLADETDTDRAVAPELLTRNEAEVVVRYYGTHQSRQEIADEMALSPNRIDRIRQAAEEDLLAAEATLGVTSDLRAEVRPDPYDETVE
jgi:hypothetical protein